MSQWALLVCFFEFCYWLKSPFFEQYKSNEEPWPWEEDQVGYKSQWWKNLKTTLFNVFIISRKSNLLKLKLFFKLKIKFVETQIVLQIKNFTKIKHFQTKHS